MQPLPKFQFPTEDIKLNVLMRQEDVLSQMKAASCDVVPQKVIDVYGELYLPEPGEDRPYTFASIVLSSDGKIAFPDDPRGPLIAGNNMLDREGGKADFWVLNMLRAYSDACLLGARTLQAEPEGTSHVFCEELAKARTEIMGKDEEYPINCIVSFDGTDIPLSHRIFAGDIRVMIGTSPEGGTYLKANMKQPVVCLGPYATKADVDMSAIWSALSAQPDAVPIFLTGSGKSPDSAALLYILRQLGIKKMCIEAPSYMWHLIENRAMDEMFINYSMVFVGGTTSMGAYRAFSATDHPHSQIISLAMHRAGFVFTRQRMRYL